MAAEGVVKAEAAEVPDEVFAFCEPVWVTTNAPWCIRRLTGVGRMLGGGVDTGSLCGRVKERGGWDLDVEITEHHLGHACKRCVAIYRGSP